MFPLRSGSTRGTLAKASGITQHSTADPAAELVAKTRVFALSTADPAATHMAWMLRNKSAAHALDYDIKLKPPRGN